MADGQTVYFLMIKRCSNACTLSYYGDNYSRAVDSAQTFSRRLRLATYVLTKDQVLEIFKSQIEKLKAWCSNPKSEAFCYLELPSNFKKFLH